MGTCNTCWAWRPKEWNGWKWTDEAAPCAVYNNEMRSPLLPCNSYSMIKPETMRVRNEFAATSTIDLMEQWYRQHESEFGDIGHKRETIEYKTGKTRQQFVYKDIDFLQDLYEHQAEDFMRFKDESEEALFLEMGCGKTAIILRIAGYKFLKEDINALLYIGPNDVHRQTAIEQIPKWLPHAIPREVQVFGGRGGLKDCRPFQDPAALHIVCVNIDTFSLPQKWQDVVLWANINKTMIVLDEATSIKSVNAKRTQRVLYEFNTVERRRKTIISSKTNSVARAILTGTPATNGVVDLWSLMEFLRPNYFGRNWYSFRNRYSMLATLVTPHGAVQIMLTQNLWEGVKGCDCYEKAYAVFGVSKDTYDTIQMQDRYMGAYKHEEELKELIKPVSVFRTLKECVDMPPQVYNKKTVQMSDEQGKAYRSMETELLAMYGGAITTAANKLSAMVRLQQISSGFIVQGEISFDPEEFELRSDDIYDIEPGEVQWLGSSIPKLEALYRDAEESARPNIIITRFSAEAARIYDDLSKQYKVLLYTGWKKTGAIEEFQRGEYDVLVANIRCISRGFNLQNAYQMFFYSNTFSLEDRLQTEGRIFRIGQRNSCVYTDYINEQTIDLKVVGALRQKRALLDYIRGTSLTAFIEEEDEVTMMEGAV